MQNILKDKILNVYLKQNEHANLDSLPLRFGFYFSDNRVLELFNCENAKRLPDENSEKYRVKASFNGLDNKERTAIFILLVDKGKYPIVKTLWIGDFYSEELLSNHIKSLRKLGKINPNNLIKMHPYYINNEANTVSGFIATQAKLIEDKDNTINCQSEIISSLENENETLKSKDIKSEQIIKTLKDELDIHKNSVKIKDKNNLKDKEEDFKQITIPEKFKLAPEPYIFGDTEAKIYKIYGPPGTGKTFTLMEKVNEYIQNGTNPKDIGFFSFTNHSINVAKNRIKEKFPHLDLRKSFKGFRTLHSLAYSTLKSNVDIITPIQANNFDKDFRIEVVIREEDDENSIVYRAKHPIIDAENIAVNKMISFEDYLKNMTISDSKRINKWLGYSYQNQLRKVSPSDYDIIFKYIEKFEEYKNSIGVINYTDIIQRAFENLQAIPKFEVVFVDEAQDLSKLEWVFAEQAFKNSKTVYIAGDDDQAICESFGASAETFTSYKSDSETVLNQSYRIPSSLHDFLFKEGHIIQKLNKTFSYRKDKVWNFKVGVEGGVDEISKKDLFNLIEKYPNKEWLIMAARNNTISKLSNLLLERNVNHLFKNQFRSSNKDAKSYSLKLATIWGAKGDEADITVLIRDGIDEDDYSDDPRIVYVAQSRAKYLHLEACDFHPTNMFKVENLIQDCEDKIIFRKLSKNTKINEETFINENEQEINDEVKLSISNPELQKQLDLINEPPFEKERFIGNRALLEDVRMSKRGSRPCVELVMNDGSRRGKIFGNLKETFRIANLLKGKYIITDVWRPDRYPEHEWFRNIFL